MHRWQTDEKPVREDNLLDLILTKNEDLLKDVKVRSNPNCSGNEMVEFLEEEQDNKQDYICGLRKKKEKEHQQTISYGEDPASQITQST